MRVGFDFNGVIIDNANTKAKVAKKYFGITVKPENTSRKSLDTNIPVDKFEEIKNIVYGTSEMLNSPPRSEKTHHYLTRFMHHHEVFIVSRIQAFGVQFGKQWLREQWLDPDQLVSVGPGGDKRLILQHDFDVYIDDDLDQLNTISSIVPHLFLVTTPQNRHAQLPWNITRITDWEELYERVEQLDQRLTTE